MEGWGVGDIPLWGRVAQPAELGSSYIFLASADSNVSDLDDVLSVPFRVEVCCDRKSAC